MNFPESSFEVARYSILRVSGSTLSACLCCNSMHNHVLRCVVS